MQQCDYNQITTNHVSISISKLKIIDTFQLLATFSFLKSLVVSVQNRSVLIALMLYAGVNWTHITSYQKNDKKKSKSFCMKIICSRTSMLIECYTNLLLPFVVSSYRQWLYLSIRFQFDRLNTSLERKKN